MQATLEMARALQRQGRHREALGAFRDLVTQDPTILAETVNSWLKVDPAKALAISGRLLARHPDFHVARHQHAEALARVGDFEAAEREMRICVAGSAHLAELRGEGEPWTKLHPRVPCSHCGADGAETIFVGNASRTQRCFGLIDPVKVWVRCETCGLVRVPRPPPADDLVRYYDALRGDGGDHAPPDRIELFQSVVAMEGFVERIEKHVPSGRLLEIGSSWGAFCAAAQYRGFDVVGLETSPDAARFGRETLGIDAIAGTAPADLPDGPFDVVALFEVIEHFTDPGAVLRALVDRLSPDGVLTLSTPDLGHPAHRAAGYDDPMWGVPGHLVYFDLDTLGRCLAKVGLSIVERWMTPNYVGSVVVIARPS